MQITRKLEFDAGHRIPFHESQCRNVHGHRYVLEVTLEGSVQPVRQHSDDGMLLDFSHLKRIMNEQIVERFDHAFLVWSGDETMIKALEVLGSEHKSQILPFIPTVENLADYCFKTLDVAFRDVYGSRLVICRVRLYETPNCWADCRGWL